MNFCVDCKYYREVLQVCKPLARECTNKNYGLHAVTKIPQDCEFVRRQWGSMFGDCYQYEEKK